MQTINATEIKQRLGQYLDKALVEPIMIEKSGRPVVVMLSKEEYERLLNLEDALFAEKIKEAEKNGYMGVEGTEDFLKKMNKKHAKA